MPSLLHIFETALYSRDLGRSERFYGGVLGLRRVLDMSPRGLAFEVGAGGGRRDILLIFDAREAAAPTDTAPEHGATGPGHVAFAIAPDELDVWRAALVAAGVAIEKETTWPNGTRSIYFRDPDRNSLELAAGDLWPA